MADDRVALTFTEMALDGGNSGGCKDSTAENPPCGRLVISGRLTLVPPEHKANAEKYLFSRHPEMAGWGKEHHFVPFWMAPENITDFFLINFYGGASHPTVKDYMAADWYGRSETETWVCGACSHVYDPDEDGGGVAFEDLPDDWTCPVCGLPKSVYEKQLTKDGRTMWVHPDPPDQVLV